MVSTCPMRRSGPGATSSGRTTRTSCAVVVRGRATHGTWMRCSSRSTAHSGTCRAGRPARQRARHSGPVAPKRGGRKEVLPPTARGPAVGALGDRTDKLASYQVAHRELVPSVTHRRSKYLNNRAEKLPPADPATRAGDETLQVDPARATVPVGVQRHLAALSAPSAPAVGGRLPTGHGRPLRVCNKITGATTTAAA